MTDSTAPLSPPSSTASSSSPSPAACPCGGSANTPANPNLAPQGATIAYDDFAKVDLRVATILTAEPHPNADRLVKLQIDLGYEKRQICAGIKAYYAPETLVGRQIIVVANLAPRTIRGEVSNGMLLAASQMNGQSVEFLALLAPDKTIAPGSKVG